MKNLKKVTSLMMAMVMSVSCMAFTASAANTTDSFDYQEAYNWAKEVGFSEGFLRGISEEALEQVYLDNIGADELEITEEVSYVSMDDPSETSFAPFADIPESMMQLRATPVKHTSAGKVTKVQIYFTAQWLDGRPWMRNDDAFVCSWDSSLWALDDTTFWGKVEHTRNGGGSAIQLLSSTRTSLQSQGGLGWYADISGSPLGWTPTIRIGFQINPKKTMPEGKTKLSTVEATYGHNTSAIGGINLSVSGPTVIINSETDNAAINCRIQHG